MDMEVNPFLEEIKRQHAKKILRAECEILLLFDYDSIYTYQEIIDKLRIPCVDMGEALQNLIDKGLLIQNLEGFVISDDVRHDIYQLQLDALIRSELIQGGVKNG